ncbi:MAG: hypothetical protein KC423_11790 [Anaerolineales bacterium]|nr:hypothetical protein [Anaerolineales bacterium]
MNWKIIVLLLTAVGGPVAAGIVFSQQVAQNPLQSALLFVLYELVLLIISFVTGLLEELQKRWVPRAADWVESLPGRWRSKPEKAYRQHLIYRHRDFDVKGLSTQGIYTLELEQVFVELSIAPQPPGKVPADPIQQLPDELRQGSHTIWQFLAAEPLQKQQFAILGAPGSGKTTLLKHMTLVLAAGKGKELPKKLPILLFLRDHAAAIATAMGYEPKQVAAEPVLSRAELRQKVNGLSETEVKGLAFDLGIEYEGLPGSNKNEKGIELLLACERQDRMGELPKLLRAVQAAAAVAAGAHDAFLLPDAVLAALKRWEVGVPRLWLQKQLAAGRCLVLLDGLDEVADPQLRRLVVAWVERQMVIYGGNRFVVTSRPFGYRSNPLSGVTVLGLQPFSRAQMSRFVHNWYRANEVMSSQKDDPGVVMKAQEGAEDLLRRLEQTPTLLELAVNPLLLTMIATVHRYRSSLPGRRVELYAEICEVFLGKRQQARGLVLDLTPAQKQAVLQPLAFAMMEGEQREMGVAAIMELIREPLGLVNPGTDPMAFLRDVENLSGLLLEREQGVYGFAHLTFQEYLAAAHVHEKKLEAALVAQVGASWWHETIRLYAAQGEATAILAACLAGEKPTVAALTLAIEVEEEARAVAPAVREQLQQVLEAWVEDEEPERRRLVAEALLARRLKRMVRLDEDRYIDSSLVTHAEYQLFLGEAREQGQFYQPDHWPTGQFAPGTGNQPVVGVRSGDAVAFVAWLNGWQAEEGWRFRLPEAEEGDRLAGSMTMPLGYWVRRAAGWFLVGDDSALPTKNQLLEWQQKDFNRDLSSTLVLNLDLARTRAHDLPRAFDLDRVLDLHLPLDLYPAPDLALDRDLARALDLAHARALDLALALARALDRAYALDLALALARALDRALDRDLGVDERDREIARYFLRLSALLLAEVFVWRRELYRAVVGQKGWLERRRLVAALAAFEAAAQPIIDAYLGLYVDLVTLEERIAGNLPAVEGIRLVKERKPTAEPPTHP